MRCARTGLTGRPCRTLTSASSSGKMPGSTSTRMWLMCSSKSWRRIANNPRNDNSSMDKLQSVWRGVHARIGGWDLPVLVLWAVTLFCIGPFVLLQLFAPNNRYGAIPVPIHSQGKADYSRDPRNRFVPAISLDILRDLMLGGEDLDEITWLQTLTATHRPPESTPSPQPTRSEER